MKRQVTLAASQTVYRVQRIRARPGAASIGPLKLAPTGDMSGRFALVFGASLNTFELVWRKALLRQDQTRNGLVKFPTRLSPP